MSCPGEIRARSGLPKRESTLYIDRGRIERPASGGEDGRWHDDLEPPAGGLMIAPALIDRRRSAVSR